MTAAELPPLLFQAEAASLLGPGAPQVREWLSGLCLSEIPEVAGRALLRRAELGMVEGNIAASHPSRTELASRLAEAIDDVQAAGNRLEENSEHELRARLLAGRLLIRSLKTGAASELLHGTRDSVKGKGRPTRLALAMAEGELALDSGAYAEADGHLRRAVGLARGDALAHDHYQATMSVAAATQLQGQAAGAVSWLRLARATALRCSDGPRLADTCFSLGNILLALDEVGDAFQSLTAAVDAGLDPTALPLALMAISRIHLGLAEYPLGVERAVEAARAGAACGNAAAFADGSIIAAQCQLGQRLVHEALDTLQAGEQVLRERGVVQLADLLAAQRYEVLVGEGLVPEEPEEPGNDEPEPS